MTPIDYILIAVIAAIGIGAVVAIILSRKKGNKCMGCPCSGSCSGSCSQTK